jgi:Ni,Fe-hydrogenase maturation factor
MTPERFTEIEQLLGSAPTKWHRAIADCLTDIRRLQLWIADLQSGMFINCVYCGHRYGRADQVSASKAEVLKQHIAHCPEHPMSELLKCVQAAAHLCEALIACREGVGDVLFKEIRDACKLAIEKAEGKL